MNWREAMERERRYCRYSKRPRFIIFTGELDMVKQVRCPQSTLLADWVPNVRKIKESSDDEGEVCTGTAWWHDDQVNATKFDRLVQSRGLRFEAAYIVVARESDAARALSIVRSLKLPYVVHMVDVSWGMNKVWIRP